ncbi:MAG TPA: AraC family transcriptional regulator ligand-binding domain-containing protein [Marinobacter sp.]|nr:AraC family transcriptional regulator ligand-binding domain-containing protein [Marinobacter sp.]
MKLLDFRRSIASVRLMVEYAVEHGATTGELLEDSQISTALFANPNTEITAGQELQVIQNLIDRFDDVEVIARDIGQRYHCSAYGLWGYGLMCSATVGEALQLALRFLPLTYAFTIISYYEEGSMGFVDFGEPQLESRLKQFVLIRDVAAAIVLMQELAGESFRFVEVSPSTFAFSRDQLNQKLPQSNPVTAALCEQQCRALMEQRRSYAGVQAIVTHYLQNSGTHVPSLLATARFLHMSERTLKRHLQAEGVSFRQLLEKVRREKAERLLNQGGVGISEIADHLGFSDASTFSQAFKRWTGKAPSYWARQ